MALARKLTLVSTEELELPRAEGSLAHIREHPELTDADLAAVRHLIPATSRMLDLGAGRGGFVLEANRRGYDAVALELDPSAAALWPRSGVPGTVADGFMTPFRSNAFNLVRMKEVIEHVQEPLRLVQEATRLLAPGGLLLAHVPSPYSQLYPIGNFWDDYTHVRPLSRQGLHRLIKDAGLQLLRIDGYVAGRNPVERLAGRILATAVPHTYRVLARRP
jgi:SAM-dependent methyltransferase